MRLRQALLECIAKRASAAQDQFLLGKLAQVALDQDQFLLGKLAQASLDTKRIIHELNSVIRNESGGYSETLGVMGQLTQMAEEGASWDELLAKLKETHDIEKSQYLMENLPDIQQSFNTNTPNRASEQEQTPQNETQGSREDTGTFTDEEAANLNSMLEEYERDLERSRLLARNEDKPTLPVGGTDPNAEMVTELDQADYDSRLPGHGDFAHRADEVQRATDTEGQVMLMYDQFGNQYGVDRTTGQASRRVTSLSGSVQWHRTPGLDFQVHNGQLQPTQNTQRMGMMNANPQNIAQQLGGNAFFDPRSGRYFRRDDKGKSTPVSSAEIWALQNPQQAQARQAAAARRQQRATDPVALANQVRAYQAAGADVPPSLAKQVENLSENRQNSYQTHLRHLTTAPDRRAMHDQQMAERDRLAAARLHVQQGRFEKDQVGRDNTQADQRLPRASTLPGANRTTDRAMRRPVGNRPQTITPGNPSITPGSPKTPETGSS